MHCFAQWPAAVGMCGRCPQCRHRADCPLCASFLLRNCTLLVPYRLRAVEADPPTAPVEDVTARGIEGIRVHLPPRPRILVCHDCGASVYKQDANAQTVTASSAAGTCSCVCMCALLCARVCVTVFACVWVTVCVRACVRARARRAPTLVSCDPCQERVRLQL